MSIVLIFQRQFEDEFKSTQFITRANELPVITLGEFPPEIQVTVSVRKHFVALIKLCHFYASRHLLPVKLVL